MINVKDYSVKFRHWFETRLVRERLLTAGLGWIIIYAAFSFFIISPIENASHALESKIAENNTQALGWKKQLDALDIIMQSALYKEWEDHDKMFSSLEKRYHLLLRNEPKDQWYNVISAVLHEQPNITVAEIKHLPEELYTPLADLNSINKIYRQKIVINVKSNYFSTIDYIRRVEKALPNLYWDSLSYQVENYPLANVQLELSIFYEKNS